MHDKSLGMEGWMGAYRGEFVRLSLLRRDVTYSGTYVPTFRMKYVASSSLEENYRPLEARFLTCNRSLENVGGTVQNSGQNLSYVFNKRT